MLVLINDPLAPAAGTFPAPPIMRSMMSASVIAEERVFPRLTNC
jgi:hypothetical protein